MTWLGLGIVGVSVWLIGGLGYDMVPNSVVDASLSSSSRQTTFIYIESGSFVHWFTCIVLQLAITNDIMYSTTATHNNSNSCCTFIYIYYI